MMETVTSTNAQVQCTPAPESPTVDFTAPIYGESKFAFPASPGLPVEQAEEQTNLERRIDVLRDRINSLEAEVEPLERRWAELSMHANQRYREVLKAADLALPAWQRLRTYEGEFNASNVAYHAERHPHQVIEMVYEGQIRTHSVGARDANFWDARTGECSYQPGNWRRHLHPDDLQRALRETGDRWGVPND